MIKRFVFGAIAPPPLAPEAFRPFRTTLSTVVAESARQEGYSIQWFADAEQLARYEAWLASPPDPAKVIHAEEVPQRGADWLAARWAEGGMKWKHVATAQRAPGLTLAEMSARWRGHAGQTPTKTSAVAVPIPDEARGLAYVQNHPLPRDSGDWLYDAITEVWFDDPAGMNARIAYFRDVAGNVDLFGEASFRAVREELVDS